MNSRWIAYGVTGALGVGALAGVAVVAANAMDLRVADERVLPGGPLGTATTVLPDVGETAKPDPLPTVSPTSPGAGTTSPKPVDPAPVTAPSPVTPPSAVSVVSAP